MIAAGLFAAAAWAGASDDEFDWPLPATADHALATWRDVAGACAAKSCTDPALEATRTALVPWCAWAPGAEPPADAPPADAIRAVAETCVATDLAPLGTAFALPSGVAQSALLGFTDFLLRRAADELRVFALDNGVRQLCPDDKHRLLPNTCALLDAGGGATLTASPVLVREALEADLRSLPRHAALVALDGAKPEQRDPLTVVAALGRTSELVLDGGTPLEALAGWSSVDPAPACEASATSALYAVSLAVAACPLDGGRRTLPDAAPEMWPVALALDARYRGVGAGCAPTGASVAAALAALRTLAADADADVDALRTLADTPGARTTGPIPAYAALGADVAAVLDVALILHPTPAPWVPAARATLEAVAAHDPPRALAAAVALLAEVGVMQGHRELADVARTASFVVALLGATDADTARQAIDAWAAPLGAYARKHDGAGKPYVVLQAYVGLTGGASAPLDGSTSAAFAVGPFVPVGLEAGGRLTGGGSFGFLGSVVDLGQLASWRIDQASGEAEGEGEVVPDPQVRVSQVFAPGLWLAIAPVKAPFAFGVGGSLAPDTLVDTADDAPMDAIRGGLWFAVDLPLFP